MPRNSLNGIELWHERQGTGTPLLCLAGMASDSASWGPLAPLLAPHFDLILPDNRCTGRTLPLPCDTSADLMLADTLALLDALGLDRVPVLGHSMGGTLALLLAQRHPDRVSAVIAMSTTGRASAPARSLFQDLAALADAPDREAWFRLLFQWLFSPGFFADRETVLAAGRAALAYPHAQPPEAFRAQVAMLAAGFPEPETARIACPLLALSGKGDLLCPPTEIVAAFPNHRLLPGAHSLHWEAPEAVAAEITAFLTA